MKSLFLHYFTLCISFSLDLSAQDVIITDTTKSIYKNLPVLKSYAISSSSMISSTTSWFKINGNSVDEKTYRKFTQYSENINNCKPCILLSYDTSENLILKRILFGDCPVGYWIEYYPNRGVKIIGHFKENTTGNWENIFEKGYCKQDGNWTYFDTNGKIKYSEIWKDGKLVKRISVKSY